MHGTYRCNLGVVGVIGIAIVVAFVLLAVVMLVRLRRSGFDPSDGGRNPIDFF